MTVYSRRLAVIAFRRRSIPVVPVDGRVGATGVLRDQVVLLVESLEVLHLRRAGEELRDPLGVLLEFDDERRLMVV